MTAASAAALIVVAYILKMRRRRFEVPFSTLWQRVLRERETTSLWRHLRRILSLLLLLSMLAVLAFAVTDPSLGSADRDARNVVIIVDTSASMATEDETIPGADGKQQRLAKAKRDAIDLIGSLGGGDMAMVMRMDGQTTPMSRFESDGDKLKGVVRKLETSDTPADLRRALSAAADALRHRQRPLIVLIGDGAYPEEALDRVRWQAPAAQAGAERDLSKIDLSTIDLSGIDVRYLPVGQARENVGIVAFNVRRYLANKLAYEVFIEVRNFGKDPARRKLVLYNGDSAVEVRTLELGPGATLQSIYPNVSGGSDSRLRALLVPLGADPSKDEEANLETVRHDAFPLDDEAFALLPERKRQDVLLVTTDNLYLEGAMLVYENIRVDKMTPDEYDKAARAGSVGDYHAVVFDDYTPEVLPAEGIHLLYFNPQGQHSPFPVRTSVSRPRITDVEENHPVMRWVEMGDVNFDKVSTLVVDRSKGEVPLMSSVRSPIAAAKREGRRKVVAFAFSLPAPGRDAATDIVLRVAFPLLLVNVLDWFAGDDSDLITTYRTGNRIRVPLDGVYGVSEATVTDPTGKAGKAPIEDGAMTFYARKTGVHKVAAVSKSGQVLAQVQLAANLSNPTESDIEPSAELNLGGQPLARPPEFPATRSQSLWTYLVMLMAGLLAIEWYTYNRRLTV